MVSNAKFAGQFSQWSETYRQASNHPFRFSVVNDGSTDDSNKLGAIGDLNLVLEQEKLDDDLIVVAGGRCKKLSVISSPTAPSQSLRGRWSIGERSEPRCVGHDDELGGESPLWGLRKATTG